MGKKNIVLTLAFSMLAVAPVVAQNSFLSLEDALKKKLVTVSISGKGAYYGPSVKMTLKNLSNQQLSVGLEAGRRLNCTYDSVQDMVVTKSDVLALLPAQKREVTIYAMCCEKHDRTPAESSVFNYGAMAQNQVVRLAVLIEKLDVQDLTGVKSIWVLTDNEDTNTVTSDNKEIQLTLRRYLRGALLSKNANVREDGFIYDYSYPKSEGGSLTFEGSFDWELAGPAYVSLYLYDNNGKQIKVLFQDVNYTAGYQEYAYKLTDPGFREGEIYWIRLKQNGRTVKEVALSTE